VCVCERERERERGEREREREKERSMTYIKLLVQYKCNIAFITLCIVSDSSRASIS
jgi:hypothetical protein